MWNGMEEKINFHVKLNKKSGFNAGDLSLSFDATYFKGNFGYQSSNICINTIINFTWNLHQDVNNRKGDDVISLAQLFYDFHIYSVDE